MSASPTQPSEPQMPPAGVEVKDASVNIQDINPRLKAFLVVAGLVHLHLFDQVLVVTSGMDAIHAKSSKHYTGNAVDIRVTDLQGPWQPAWILCLRVLAMRYNLAVFDESYAPGMQHVHVEIAG